MVRLAARGRQEQARSAARARISRWVARMRQRTAPGQPGGQQRAVALSCARARVAVTYPHAGTCAASSCANAAACGRAAGLGRAHSGRGRVDTRSRAHRHADSPCRARTRLGRADSRRARLGIAAAARSPCRAPCPAAAYGRGDGSRPARAASPCLLVSVGDADGAVLGCDVVGVVMDKCKLVAVV